MSTRLQLGAALIITADEAALLALSEKATRRYWRESGRPLPALLDDLLLRVREVAIDRVPVLPSASGSEDVPIGVPRLDAVCSEDTSSISTDEAARQLGITARGVVALLHRGRLDGEQDRTKGTWRIQESSVRARQQRQTRKGLAS